MTESPFGLLRSQLEGALLSAMSACGFASADIGNTIQPSKGFGDLSCSASFGIAKSAKKKPSEVAESILSKLSKPAAIREIRVENGFINFSMDRKVFSSDAVRHAMAGDYSMPARKGKIIIEFPSVNPAHPWHVGHLRNALLGDCISRLHKALGYDVEREDYIDDLGLQCAQAVWGTINIDKIDVEQGKQRKADHSIGEVYVAVNRLLDQKPEVAEQVGRVLQLMDQEGTYEAKIAHELAESCVRAQYETAFAFGICHDAMVWESDILRGRLLDRALAMLDKHGLAKRPSTGKYAGCVVVELADLKDLPRELQGLREEAKVLVRSNGTPNYIAKDIAFHMWKLGMLENSFRFSKFIDKQPDGKPLYSTGSEGTVMDFGNANHVINTIDTKQSFEQAVVRVILDHVSDPGHGRTLQHLAYGVVELEGGSIAGRKGTWIGYTADDLLNEARSRAASLIKGGTKIPDKERDGVATKVGLGAIKFEFLKISPEKKIVFSWDRALNFEGDSGPYSQYMYARAVRLMEDSGARDYGGFDAGCLVGDTEFALVKSLSMAQQVAEKARAELRPNVLTDYCNELSSCFSKFYDLVPILKAKDDREKLARLALVRAFANTISYSLSLLGIPTLNRM